MRKSLPACVFLLALSTAAQAAPVGVVVAAAGQVSIDGHPAADASLVDDHSTITVGVGTVQIQFNDGTKLVLGDGSTLKVDQYVAASGGTASNFAVDALRGTFRFITGHSAKTAYHINSADATIGIRGTGFDFYSDKETGIVLLDGMVNFCNKKSTCVILEPRCEAALTRPDSANKISGYTESNMIRQRLPYIMDQSSLLPQFRLPTQKCDAVLGPDGAGNKQQPPTPAAKPRPR